MVDPFYSCAPIVKIKNTLPAAEEGVSIHQISLIHLNSALETKYNDERDGERH